MELGHEAVPIREVSSFQRVLCTSMELGPEDVSLLEGSPYFRRCYVETMELVPLCTSIELAVPIREVPHFRGWYLKMCPY